MSAPKIGILIIGMLAFTLFITTSSYMHAADTNEDRSLQQAAASAMSQGINMGQVRVDEEITVNEDIVKEALVRQYVEQSNLNDGERHLYVYALASQPAMLAVESYNTFSTPLPRYLELKDDKVSVRQMENIIYEAKKVNKPN
ncbi:DUF5411 family protein [Bacillus cereus]|uniref:DUF5411 family protein n=1 Tax=Bacillus cereus group TaxID=86661 RepID=UPI003014A322